MDRLEKPHEILVQSDSAKAVGVRDWPGLDMQVVNDKKRQEASSAGRRFGRMTCGRCVALHPSFYPEAWPGLGIGGCSASSDPPPGRRRRNLHPSLMDIMGMKLGLAKLPCCACKLSEARNRR